MEAVVRLFKRWVGIEVDDMVGRGAVGREFGGVS